MHSCSRLPPRSSGRSPSHRGRGRPDHRRGLRADRERRAVGHRARERLPGAHRRARRDAQPRGRSRVDQCVGARVRGVGAGGGCARRSGAPRPAAAALGHPGRAEGPVRRRRPAPDRVEQPARRASGGRLRCLGAPARPGHDPARPPPHPRVRRGRDDRSGRQPVGARAHRPAAPAAVRRRRWPPAWCPAATGTDTAGSLRIPSALSGVSTIKPTRGRVSLRGVVPLATSLDHAGPMARTLEDCALLLPAHGRPRPRPPRQCARRRSAGFAPAAAARSATAGGRPPRALAPDGTGRARRRRGRRRRPGARCVRGARRRAGRAPSARRAARHRRRIPRRALRGAARLPPPLRRPSRALPPLAARMGGAGRGARHLGGALRGRAALAARDDRRLRAVAPGRADHRRAGADGALRRARARRRLRPRRQRLRADLAHPLLELDGLPGRRPALGCGLAQRVAGERLADRAGRLGLGSARRRHPATGRARRAESLRSAASRRPRRAAGSPARPTSRSGAPGCSSTSAAAPSCARARPARSRCGGRSGWPTRRPPTCPPGCAAR